MKKSLLDKTKRLTKIDNKHKDLFRACACITEEVGELAKDLVDGDVKHAKDEAVDVIITGLSMFYALNGKNAELEKIMSRQLNKWEKNYG
jgi:NTP pyrophosphatase (non-canonical NTP hydrolase)